MLVATVAARPVLGGKVTGPGELRVHRIVCAVDCGRIVNPDIVRAQIESGVVYGISGALWG